MKQLITIILLLFSMVAISQEVTISKEEWDAMDAEQKKEVEAAIRTLQEAEDIDKAAKSQMAADSIAAAISSNQLSGKSWTGKYSDGTTLLTISYIENSDAFYYKLVTATECWSDNTQGKAYFSENNTATSGFQDTECSLLFTKHSNTINIEYSNCDGYLGNANCPPLGDEFVRE